MKKLLLILLICYSTILSAQTDIPIVTYEQYVQMIEETPKIVKVNTFQEVFDVFSENREVKMVKVILDKKNNIVEYYSLPRIEYIELYGIKFRCVRRFGEEPFLLSETKKPIDKEYIEEVKALVIKIRNELYPNEEIVSNFSTFKVKHLSVSIPNGSIQIICEREKKIGLNISK